MNIKINEKWLMAKINIIGENFLLKKICFFKISSLDWLWIPSVTYAIKHRTNVIIKNKIQSCRFTYKGFLSTVKRNVVLCIYQIRKI